MGNSCCSATCSSENEIAMDLEQLEKMMQDVGNLDSLIFILDQRLEAFATTNERIQRSTSIQAIGSSSAFASWKNFGENLAVRMLKRAERNYCMACLKSGYNRETRKVVLEVLKGATQIQLLAAGVCVVGFLLDQIEQISKNREQCVQLLRWLCALAKHVKQSYHQIPAERGRLDEAVIFIFKGCILCLTQMKSHRLCRVFQASVDAENLQNLVSEIRNTYSSLTLGVVLDIRDNIPHYLPSRPGEDPKPVGRKVTKDQIIRDLKMDPTDKSKRAVIVYGFGGIGKTILATSICSNLDLEGYKYCRLDMDKNCSDNHIKELQQKMLRVLFDQRNVLLEGYVEGRDELTKAFRKAEKDDYRIFLFIDNVLAAEDLSKLLPNDFSCFPSGMRIIVTTRMLDQTVKLDKPHFERIPRIVEQLSDADSKKLLFKKALGSANASLPQGIESKDVDDIVKLCYGIPLMLELAGPMFKEGLSGASGVKSVKGFLEESVRVGEGDEIERMVDVVYKRLDKLTKEAFLDIACFFDKQPRREIIAAVGEVHLKRLLGAALVKVILDDDTENLFPSEWNSKVFVHDIIKARGRQLAQSDRIFKLDSLKDALKNTQKFQEKKGIGIPAFEVKHELEIEAECLNDMYSSLRVVSLPKSIIVKGTCDRSFENLRYLEIEGHLPISPMQLEHLAVLKTTACENIGELPASLHLLSLKNSANIPTNFGHLESLTELNLSGCSNLSALPQSIVNLNTLELLNLSHCTKLVSLPPSFGQLKSLISLLMEDCSSFTIFPVSLGDLSSLHLLDLRRCTELDSLPRNFGKLSALKLLDLSGCANLKSLPESFGQLTSLKILDMSYCEHLTSLPDNFGNLKSLEFLNIDGCENLKTLHSDFRALTSLMNLWAMGIRLRVI